MEAVDHADYYKNSNYYQEKNVVIVNDLSSSEGGDQPSVGHNINSFDMSQTFEYNQDLSMAMKTSEVPL